MATTYWTGVKPLDNPDAIERLEEKYNIKFPVSYKRFAKQFNGSIPKPNGVRAETGEEFDVKCLLSFNGGETNSIYKPMESLMRCYCGTLIPFAVDSLGNHYCFRGERVVLFKKGDVVRICDDFGSFADNLREF